MLSASRNLDIVCLQIWDLRENLETPLKKDLNKFLAIVIETLTGKRRLNTLVKQHFDDIFLFRFRALKWLIESGDFDLNEMLDSIYPEIEQFKINTKYSLLAENVLFALRSNKRVVESLITNEIINEDSLSDSLEQVKVLTYSQFLTSLTFAIPDADAMQTVISWTNSSLIIEFGTIASMLVFKEEIKCSKKRINELAELISDASQEYTACALQMGLLKIASKSYLIQDDISLSVVNEEKAIADWGFDDFAAKISKE